MLLSRENFASWICHKLVHRPSNINSNPDFVRVAYLKEWSKGSIMHGNVDLQNQHVLA